MSFYKIRKIYGSEIFQGHRKKNNYFEGWYFKLVDSSLNNAFAIIPGVSISKKTGGSHAFIQVMDGKRVTSKNFKFDISEFSYSTEKFEIKIGNNFFSPQNLSLSINQDLSIIEARLKFFDISRWPVTILAPGAMGWYSYVPFMECYHGVVSMDHMISGHLEIDGTMLDLSGGKGYIEKDWGVSFPKGWIWLQSNHFKGPDQRSKTYLNRTSVMLSIANIPWRSRHFTGFICGLMINKDFYVFATYNRSKLSYLECSDKKFTVELDSRKNKVIITGKRESGATLLSPVLGAMDGRISESINARVHISLLKKMPAGRTITIFEGDGVSGGLEIVNPSVLST